MSTPATMMKGFPDKPVKAIVIGASAGGVEALVQLLPALPAGTDVPVLVVLHQPRDRASLLVEIFTPLCALPVREPNDKDPIDPGTIYFAPPDYHMLVDGAGNFALSADEAVNFSRPSIDVLFESAADVYGAGLMAIVLTGANHDGAAGLKAVGDAGGRTIVQQPEGAHAWLMPQSAIGKCPGAQVLGLPEIAEIFRAMGASGNDASRGAGHA
ncbi:MAG: chemotaxis protein CheB [Betaproteobacteria bacterium]